MRQHYSKAVDQSGRPLTTGPLFMALILVQQKTIELSAQTRLGRYPGQIPEPGTICAIHYGRSNAYSYVSAIEKPKLSWNL